MKNILVVITLVLIYGAMNSAVYAQAPVSKKNITLSIGKLYSPFDGTMIYAGYEQELFPKIFVSGELGYATLGADVNTATYLYNQVDISVRVNYLLATLSENKYVIKGGIGFKGGYNLTDTYKVNNVERKFTNAKSFGNSNGISFGLDASGLKVSNKITLGVKVDYIISLSNLAMENTTEKMPTGVEAFIGLRYSLQ